MKRTLTIAMVALCVAVPAVLTLAWQTECPLVVPENVKVEIAEMAFVAEVQGMDGNIMKLDPEKMKTFRIALVTLKVTKPADVPLTIAAADLTLHYNRSTGEAEATPCEGLSVFNRILDEDRPMKLPRMAGPGFVKQTTGARAAQGSTVYIDAVFGYIEPNIQNVWICVGHPSQAASFTSTGWKSPS